MHPFGRHGDFGFSELLSYLPYPFSPMTPVLAVLCGLVCTVLVLRRIKLVVLSQRRVGMAEGDLVTLTATLFVRMRFQELAILFVVSLTIFTIVTMFLSKVAALVIAMIAIEIYDFMR